MPGVEIVLEFHHSFLFFPALHRPNGTHGNNKKISIKSDIMQRQHIIGSLEQLHYGSLFLNGDSQILFEVALPIHFDMIRCNCPDLVNIVFVVEFHQLFLLHICLKLGLVPLQHLAQQYFLFIHFVRSITKTQKNIVEWKIVGALLFPF